MLLEVKDVHSYYEKAHVLHGINLTVGRGEVVCLLGRNGVGKSTILKSIAGTVRIGEGTVGFKGFDLVGLAPHKIIRLGIGYVPEERRIFSDLTVEENLQVGIKVGSEKKTAYWTMERFFSLYPELGERSHLKGGFLSGGQQQLLTIGRTLMGNPDLILVDEPTEGLAPLLVERIFIMLQEILTSGASILLVDNSISEVLELASRVYVISKGEVVFEGTSEEFAETDEIRVKYLEV